MEVENSDPKGLLTFPSESKIPFSKAAANSIPLAIKLQTWKHPYISDRNETIMKIYHTFGFFKNSFCNYNEIINSSLDILSLLCISDKFVLKFLNFTKETIACIFINIIRKHGGSMISYVKALKSILFFLSILYCRPVQGVTKLQSQLWSLARDNEVNLIMNLIKLLEKSPTPLDGVSVRTWVYHVLSGLSQCIEIQMMLKNMPIFNREVFEKCRLKKVTPEKMGEHTEFCIFGRRLMNVLHVQKDTWFVEMPYQVVEQTLVPLHGKELLALIHQHLQHKGLNEVADLLRKDGDLPVSDPLSNIPIYEGTAMAGGMSKPKRFRGSINQTSIMVCSVLPPKPDSSNTNSKTLDDIVKSFISTQQGGKNDGLIPMFC